jgi:predicted RNase H-like HicB family nuclease
MTPKFVLTDYVEQAMLLAIYDKLEDGTFAGKIPQCKGVIAFAPTLRECEIELRSTLEDWILVGLKLGHPLPVIAGIDLNRKAQLEPVDSMQAP